MINLYEKMWNEILKYDKFTICTHIFPDGDTIGSAYALKYMILEAKPNAEIKISGDKAPIYLKKIDETEKVSDKFFKESKKIVVDTGSLKRIADKRVVLSETLNIDHHHDEDKFELRIGGDHWPATGQVLYEMINYLNLPITKKIAEGIFYSIWTDTEGMTQRNINNITKQAIKELGANGIKEECLQSLEYPDNIKNIIVDLKKSLKTKGNVTYFCKDIELPKEYYKPIIAELSNFVETEIYVSVLRFGPKTIRGSLRSKGNIDISYYAKRFGGGGHLSSAGFLPKSFEIGQKNIDYLLEKEHNSR